MDQALAGFKRESARRPRRADARLLSVLRVRARARPRRLPSIRHGVDIESLHVDVCTELPLFADLIRADARRDERPGVIQIPGYASLTDAARARCANRPSRRSIDDPMTTTTLRDPAPFLRRAWKSAVGSAGATDPLRASLTATSSCRCGSDGAVGGVALAAAPRTSSSGMSFGSGATSRSGGIVLGDTLAGPLPQFDRCDRSPRGNRSRTRWKPRRDSVWAAASNSCATRRCRRCRSTGATKARFRLSRKVAGGVLDRRSLPRRSRRGGSSRWSSHRGRISRGRNRRCRERFVIETSQFPSRHHAMAAMDAMLLPAAPRRRGSMGRARHHRRRCRRCHSMPRA